MTKRLNNDGRILAIFGSRGGGAWVFERTGKIQVATHTIMLHSLLIFIVCVFPSTSSGTKSRNFEKKGHRLDKQFLSAQSVIISIIIFFLFDLLCTCFFIFKFNFQVSFEFFGGNETEVDERDQQKLSSA